MGAFTFTVEDVVEQIRALAAERPDYVYRPDEFASCSYVTGRDGEGCIVGQALMRLGVPAELLARWESGVTGGMGSRTLLQLLLGHEESYSRGAGWIAAVQGRQDGLVPWGEAVAGTDAYLPPRVGVS